MRTDQAIILVLLSAAVANAAIVCQDEITPGKKFWRVETIEDGSSSCML